MATNRQRRQRALDTTEFERVETTAHPAIASLSDKELGETIAWLRERRDRARDLANRQRRDVRGKSERPAGFDQADAGNREKSRLLAEAVSRAQKERTRRAGKQKKSLVQSAQSALAAKASKPAASRPSPGRTASKGFKPVDRQSAIPPRERSQG
jgi:hypothetical protein